MTLPGTYGLGVDLGTTCTAAAVWRDGRAETVPLGLKNVFEKARRACVTSSRA